MQQLTYINLRGERAVFGRGAPYLLRSVRGVGACDNALTLTEDGARDGGRLLSLRREAREITAVIQILGTTRQGLYESREALCRVLSPDLAADGPFLYGSEPREAVFRQTSGGFRLPGRLPVRLGSQVFQMRVTNGGSAFAPCVVTVEGSGETPALVNRTTGAALRLTSPLPYGERLTIRTDPAALAVTLTREDGSGENAFGYLDHLSSVAAFGLRPGENDIEYVPTGDRSRSVIRVRWYDTFEGV